MKKLFKQHAWILFAICLNYSAAAQQAPSVKTTLVAWDGMMVVGYVNNGAFINFGGPSLKFVRKPWILGFGILPTMRIKEDKVPKDSKKNSPVTPTAGFGATVAYKRIVLQVPFYYNPKTTASDGKWYPGVGIGFKF